MDPLLSPYLEGEMLTITLPKAAVERGKRYYQFALIGRLDFGKISIVRARIIVAEIRKPRGDWKLIPLGNGFFKLKLDSRDDYIRIWSQLWKVGDHCVCFTKWTPNFDPEKQKSSNMLFWVRFLMLPLQYWDYKLIIAMGKVLGTPIGVDKRTMEREYGYFINVLVDVDVSNPVPMSFNVREEGGK